MIALSSQFICSAALIALVCHLVAANGHRFVEVKVAEIDTTVNCTDLSRFKILGRCSVQLTEPENHITEFAHIRCNTSENLQMVGRCTPFRCNDVTLDCLRLTPRQTLHSPNPTQESVL